MGAVLLGRNHGRDEAAEIVPGARSNRVAAGNETRRILWCGPFMGDCRGSLIIPRH